MNRILRASAVSMALLATATAQAVDFSLVSLRSGGSAPSGYSDGSEQPAITPGGRYVVFVGDSDLVTPAVTGYQVYLRDRVMGTTELISVSTTGGGANNSNSLPSISDDGCRVAFMSYASNLVAGDANGGQDLFVRDRCVQPATTSLASVSSAGLQANAQSYEGRISGDGRKVVFISWATNLASLTGAGSSCLFLRDLSAGTTSAITTASGTCITAAVPDISRDGSRVAFWAYWSPGTSSIVNGVWQIYLYDFAAAAGSQPVVISTNSSGAPQAQGGEGASTVTAPAISSDGGYVAFRSRGEGLVAPAGSGISHVYVKELSTGVIVRASVDSAGNPGNADSSGSGEGYRPGLARYAETVTFLTSATNLAAETGGFFPNVVAHNPYTGRTVGFTADRTLSGTPAITDGGELLVAYSGYALDPAHNRRGMFTFPGMTARLGNISTRGQVLGGDNVMIGGFIIGGSGRKTVLIRARGPSMTAAGVAGVLANPQVTLVNQATGTIIAINDNWGDAANAGEIAATGNAPTNSLESAILTSLEPGGYTAVVSGVGGGTGVGIVEVFEIDKPEVPLTNISTRGRVLTGDNVMIGGFIIDGSSPKTVLIRARGPSMIPAGVTDALADPQMTLVNSSQLIVATNDNWGSAANAGDISATGLAPTNSLESAILITLNPGAYTVVVSGVGGLTGVGIVEVFAE